MASLEALNKLKERHTGDGLISQATTVAAGLQSTPEPSMVEVPVKQSEFKNIHTVQDLIRSEANIEKVTEEESQPDLTRTNYGIFSAFSFLKPKKIESKPEAITVNTEKGETNTPERNVKPAKFIGFVSKSIQVAKSIIISMNPTSDLESKDLHETEKVANRKVANGVVKFHRK